MKNLSYLISAYGIIWVVLFAYLLKLIRKCDSLEKEIISLKESLSRNK